MSQYRIKSVWVKNFKCFNNDRYYCFEIDNNKSPIILTGPNGFGKTTFFDAIELTFSKRITRFCAAIESKATNLMKNVLLNEASSDGIIVVALQNEEGNCLTIVTRIDCQVKKVAYEESISYAIADRHFSSDELDAFVSNYTDWKSTLEEYRCLKYSDENFDVYYYVSQAESVHFLKKAISDRKDSLNTLLNLDGIEGDKEFLIEQLIGKKSNSQKVLINDEINACTQFIRENAKRLAELEKEQTHYENVPFFSIVTCDDTRAPFWDSEDLSKYSSVDMDRGIAELERFSLLAMNYGDYEKQIKNKEIDDAAKCAMTFLPIVLPFFADGVVDTAKIKNNVNDINKHIEIFNKSSFFRAEKMDVGQFNATNIQKISELEPSLITFDTLAASEICKEIQLLEKQVTEKNGFIIKLVDARKALHNSYSLQGDSGVCPYCGFNHGNKEKLEEAFVSVSELLEKDSGDLFLKVQELKKKLDDMLKISSDRISKYLRGYESATISKKVQLCSSLNEVISSPEIIKKLEQVYSLMQKEDGWASLNGDDLSNEILRICMAAKDVYENALFEDIAKENNFASLLKEYDYIEWNKQKTLVDDEKVRQKNQYLLNEKGKRFGPDISLLKGQIRNKAERLLRLETIRKNLDSLLKYYETIEGEYKDQVLKKLRVPLLIYSGKILQDYQNGLGVFISKGEMRFVSNGEAKHDVLNTFSSGQLSGFVLAFLFAMNKQYIKKSEDDLGFILIDDPVQTMDDINISSMIEVLRNDFADKQIILSTHESDKERYILYKFFKYGIKGQAFNVKEELYSNI